MKMGFERPEIAIYFVRHITYISMCLPRRYELSIDGHRAVYNHLDCNGRSVMKLRISPFHCPAPDSFAGGP